MGDGRGRGSEAVDVGEEEKGDGDAVG